MKSVLIGEIKIKDHCTVKNWDNSKTIKETMKCINKHDLNENKQTENYPTDMKPLEAYFI